MIQEREKFNIQDQADTVAKLAWYSFGQKNVRNLLNRPEAQEVYGKVILPRDKRGNKRRLVLGTDGLPLNLSFLICLLDFSTRTIRVYLDEYSSIETDFKGIYHFELVPNRKTTQLTPR